MWVTPTSASGWTNSDNARDDDTGTYANAASPPAPASTPLLQLPISPAIECSKIRVWLSQNGPGTWYVDVYYSGGWHNIRTGAIDSDQWVEINVGSTETISEARIKLTAASPPVSDLRVYEFDFYRANQVLDFERKFRGVGRGVMRGV